MNGALDDDEPEVIWATRRETGLRCETIVELCHDGDPKSKARARVTRKGHAYTPKSTVDAERALAHAVRARLPRGWRPDGEFQYGILAIFFTENRQRRDIDNMLKLVNDALNGVVFKDDSQISEVAARVVRADRFPRTHLRVYRTMLITRMAKIECSYCGKDFEVYPSSRRKYCSLECANSRRRTGRTFEVKCKNCDKIFTAASHSRQACSAECRHLLRTVIVTCVRCGEQHRRPKSWVKKVSYCSLACQAEVSRGKILARNAGVCVDCQGPTSKKTYDRCQACSWAHRAGRPKTKESPA